MARAIRCPARRRHRRRRRGKARAARAPRNSSQKKSPARAGLDFPNEAYFLVSSAFLSLFALPLPLALAFFSPFAFFAGFAWSFLVSVDGGVDGVGAWANAVNANVEATRIASSFLSMGILLLYRKRDPVRIFSEQRARRGTVDRPG